MDYVMIIDDSVTIRKSIELVIKNLGVAIKHAQNGKEALNVIKGIKESGDNLSLCITDVNMPVMDGITFVKEFRKDDRFTPVLMLTTEAGEAAINAGKEAGASGWIVKPFRTDQLIDAVKKFIR
ncbi:MAG: response regulator [Spirochaetes bacterium]|nr:response regulator [Spirochaetota bacterium]